MSDYKQTVEIEGPERAVEQIIHKLHTECENANRYGKDVSVRRIQEDTEHSTEFDQ
jgi:hypothetical protein